MDAVRFLGFQPVGIRRCFSVCCVSFSFPWGRFVGAIGSRKVFALEICGSAATSAMDHGHGFFVLCAARNAVRFLLGRFRAAKTTVFEGARPFVALAREIFGRVRLVLAVLGRLVFFGVVLLMFCIACLGGFLLKTCLQNFLVVTSCFSDRSLCLSFHRRHCSCVCVFFSLSLSFSLSIFFLSLSVSPPFARERSGSNRSHAPLPLALVWSCFVFCCFWSHGRGFCFWSRPFRCASFFFWRFFRGAFLSLCVFGILSVLVP